MAASNAHRKATERDRKAAAGLVRVEVWVPASAAQRIRDEAEKARAEKLVDPSPRLA